jgi:hypothetical protein
MGQTGDISGGFFYVTRKVLQVHLMRLASFIALKMSYFCMYRQVVRAGGKCTYFCKT